MRAAVSCVALSLAAAVPASANWQPTKNVEIVVAQGPGGGMDRTARMMQKIMQEQALVKVPVVVANRTGGAGVIAQNAVLSVGPDAHYLHVTATPILTNEITGVSSTGYRSFTPLAYLYDEYVGFAVRPDSALKTAKDLMAALKSRPDGLAMSNATAPGNSNHVAAALLLKSVGADAKKLRVAIFNSGAQSVQAILGGHVDFIVAPVGNLIPQMRGGKLNVLAVAAPRRLEGTLSTVPTWRENGADIVVSSVRMVLGPKGLKPEHVEFWEKSLAAIDASAEWRQFIQQVDGVPAYRGSRELATFLNSEFERYRAILGELGLAKQP